MRVVIMMVWINIVLMVGHILYQFLKCCCKPKPEMPIAKFEELKFPEEPEELGLPPPPPPKIVIAPPKDIEIPSAGVDADFGTEFKHDSDVSVENQGVELDETAIAIQNRKNRNQEDFLDIAGGAPGAGPTEDSAQF